MNNILNKIDTFFRNLNLPVFIAIIVLLTYIVVLPSIFLPNNHNAGSKVAQYPIVYLLPTIIILAPVLETLISQALIIELFKKRFGNTITILISASFFGLMHYYSLAYIINTFFVGIIFAYAYIIYQEKNKKPFWVVCSIHALRNLISFILLSLLK